jgi:hypothetical protein
MEKQKSTIFLKTFEKKMKFQKPIKFLEIRMPMRLAQQFLFTN